MVPHEQLPLKAEVKPKKKSLRQRYEHVKENITVEPVLAFYVIPGVLSRLATQNLNLDKACRVNMQFGDSVCDALIAKQGESYQKEELAVQELIAGMEVWKNVLLTAVPSFLMLFIGAWSDRTGKRKLCIFLPIFGELLVCISNIANAYFFYELPVQVTIFFEAFFPAITGGWITTYMGIFCYISDISSEETRTFRVGLTSLCMTAGGPIGSALSGILLNHIGYFGVFSLTSLLYLFSFSYGLYHIKDPVKIHLEDQPTDKSTGFGAFLKTFFDTKHVKDTFNVAFKKGSNNRRTKSILIFVCIACIYGPAHGEFTIRYLFTRYRFNWDALKYSFYSTFYICVHSIGALISISLFSRRLKWHDSVLGLISSVSKIAGALGTGLARNSLDMYLAVAIEMFNATPFTALRSISSKLVTSDELGKMMSLFNLTEVVTSMIFGLIYSWTYMVTLKLNAGFVFFLSTVLSIPSVIIFWWFYNDHKKSVKNDEVQEKETKPKETALISSFEVADIG